MDVRGGVAAIVVGSRPGGGHGLLQVHVDPYRPEEVMYLTHYETIMVTIAAFGLVIAIVKLAKPNG